MRARLLSSVAVAAAVAFAPASSAAGPQIVDKADDANYLNDNAPVVLPAEHPANDNPTPEGSTPAADILSVEWKSLYDRKRVLQGFTVTMVLKAPPTKPGVLYRATAETTDCSTLWLQHYSSKPKLTPQSSLRHTCDGDTAVVVAIPARVQGSSITWVVEFKNRATPKVVKRGTELVALSAHSRDFVDNPQCVDATRCTTNPTQYDVTATSRSTYRVGS